MDLERWLRALIWKISFSSPVALFDEKAIVFDKSPYYEKFILTGNKEKLYFLLIDLSGSALLLLLCVLKISLTIFLSASFSIPKAYYWIVKTIYHKCHIKSRYSKLLFYKLKKINSRQFFFVIHRHFFIISLRDLMFTVLTTQCSKSSFAPHILLSISCTTLRKLKR